MNLEQIPNFNSPELSNAQREEQIANLRNLIAISERALNTKRVTGFGESPADVKRRLIEYKKQLDQLGAGDIL